MKNTIRQLLTVLCFFGYSCLLSAQDSGQYLLQLGQKDSLYSKVLKETRTIYIQLPDSYDAKSEQKYPVAYILDGELLLPVVHLVQSFYSGGFMPEMILVGIVNDQNRTRDLTPSKTALSTTDSEGEAETFLLFIQQELIPFIDKKYPTTSYRTLIGHSYAGLFAIYTLLHHPELFANYIAIDPSLDWDGQKLLKEAKSILSKKDYRKKSLYMSLSGQLHPQKPEITIDNVLSDSSDFTLFARSNVLFSNLVKESKSNGLAFEWEFYKDDLHGTIPLPSILDGLRTTFQWFQMEQTEKFNNFETPAAELEKLITYRAKKLESHFGYQVAPYPEELLNVLGYMSLDMEQTDKAQLFFELCIEYYPESVNVYDSMADFYEAQQQYQKALKYAKKADEMSPNETRKERIKDLQSKK